jgi:hypothetical protein
MTQFGHCPRRPERRSMTLSAETAHSIHAKTNEMRGQRLTQYSFGEGMLAWLLDRPSRVGSLQKTLQERSTMRLFPPDAHCLVQIHAQIERLVKSSI